MNTTKDDGGAARFDREAVHEKYLEERDKRLVAGRSAISDLRSTSFAKYREDPFTPFVHREPITDDVDVAVIGAGIAGLAVGAELRKAGIERIRLIDEAGGVGGTWYWNRYPGIMCDVESYVYIPMLEELDYIPKTRYAFGDEIREQLEALAEKFDLVDDGLFHTRATSTTWNEELAALDPPHRPGRRGPGPLRCHGGRHPESDEASGYSGYGTLQGEVLPHSALGLCLHGRRSRRELGQTR